MTDRDAMAFGFELGREWIDNGFQNPRSHWRSDLVPLLELQEWQHRATFTSIIGLSFHSVVIEVSHVALRLLSPLVERFVIEIAQQHPALWRAYRYGFLRDDDFSTFALLQLGSKVGYADDTVVKRYEFLAQ